MSWRMMGLTLVALLTTGCHTAAAEPEPTGDALQTIITQSADRFAQAFAGRDAQALAALFTLQAEYVDDSATVFHGRAAIEAEYAARFTIASPGKLDIEVISIRPIAAGVVVEEGVSTFRPEKEGAVSQTHYTATHVRQADGAWLLASVRELNAPQVTIHDRLKSLTWLLGHWREESAGSIVNTEWKWTEDGNALVSHFSVREASALMKAGTHRVGWDSERNQFRSWVFDSTGGFAEGCWAAEDDGIWSVQLSGVDAEGARIATTLTYQRDGDENLVITQQQRTRGGVALPAIASRVVRQPPAPASKTAQSK